MAFEQIFSNVLPRRVTLQYNDGSASRTLLKIDCTRSEELSMDAQATLHEVEDGSQISDHIIKRGRTLQLEGIISDAPITLTGTIVGNAAGFTGSRIGGAAGTIATAGTVIMANLALAGSPKPSKAALDIFDEIYEKGTLLSIIGGLATYENMVMEKFSAPRNAATGGALVFKASFRQITIASGQSVEIPKEAKSDAIKDLSATERHQGVKQGTVLEETKASRPASWAYRLIWGSN